MMDTAHVADSSGATMPPVMNAGASCVSGCVDDTGLGQAAFNPFSSIGVVAVRQAAPAAPEPEGGDWTLALVVMVVGMGLIARLMREMVN
jgi:hypothetical protein